MQSKKTRREIYRSGRPTEVEKVRDEVEHAAIKAMGISRRSREQRLVDLIPRPQAPVPALSTPLSVKPSRNQPIPTAPPPAWDARYSDRDSTTRGTSYSPVMGRLGSRHRRRRSLDSLASTSLNKGESASSDEYDIDIVPPVHISPAFLFCGLVVYMYSLVAVTPNFSQFRFR